MKTVTPRLAGMCNILILRHDSVIYKVLGCPGPWAATSRMEEWLGVV